MSIVNFGSINIDLVYRVHRFVQPGETIHALEHQRFAGGKGFNQSIALARAGAKPQHIGRVGPDGQWLLDMLETEGVDTKGIETCDMPTGHAVIQVDAQGENSILVHGGANQAISEAQLSKACSQLGEADWVVLQNEINALAAVMEAARTQGSTIVLNPSPMEDSIHQLPLHAVDVFILNRSEGEALSGEREVERILDALRAHYPRASTVLTLGDQGVRYVSEGERIVVPAEPVSAHDTTGAGDTFAGFFLAERYAGVDPTPALRTACRAAALCVTRPGAAASIPRRSELAQES